MNAEEEKVLKMRRFYLIIFMLILALVAFGCGARPAITSTPIPTVQPAAVTATPGVTMVTPTGNSPTGFPTTGQAGEVTETPTLPPSSYNILKVANSCNLINSQDLAHLFPPHNEIVKDQPKTSTVSHPPFSEAAATGTENVCTFFDFHQPGGVTGWMLQITYLVDIPDPSATTAWSQAWAAAKTRSSQPVSGLGDDAFIGGTNLYLKIGDAYLTFEADDTHLDAKTASGAQQLIAYEKQLASNAMERLK